MGEGIKDFLFSHYIVPEQKAFSQLGRGLVKEKITC
jgi:hypothetical protein